MYAIVYKMLIKLNVILHIGNAMTACYSFPGIKLASTETDTQLSV